MKRWPAWIAIASVLAGCSKLEPPVAVGGGAQLTAAELQGPLIRLALPSTDEFGDLESLISVEQGYAALFRKPIGQGKSQAGWQHSIFRSDDGLHWQLASEPPTASSVDLRTLAYGAGRFLLAGHHGDVTKGAVLLTSSDASDWQPLDTQLPAILTLAYLNSRFFALALSTGIFNSSDGEHFSGANTEAGQLGALAYGAGTFVAVGSGPIEVSRNGDDWQAVPLSCDLPKACVTPPGGNPMQRGPSHVFFGDGRFFADQFVSSDGQDWQLIADDARVPNASADGWLLKVTDTTLSAWHGDEPQLHSTVRDDNPEQLDCREHRCLLLPNALLLVP
jgi:hypothetical protein